MIKVMIIDDSAVVRETLTNILSNGKDFEVIATAGDPLIAQKKLETLEPDVTHQRRLRCPDQSSGTVLRAGLSP